VSTEQATVGKISATEHNPTTADEFHFWLRSDARVSPFDIVAVPSLDDSMTYGQITDLFHVTDSPSHIGNYVSSDFGNIEEVANTPRLGTTYVRTEVLNNSRGIYMPLLDGRPVRFATAEEVKAALGIDRIPEGHIAVPGGFIHLRSGETVVVSLDSYFLLGPDGAHLNIGGISGLATKTSYAMFLLRAIQQRHKDAAIIVMNLKGEDLLHLHEPYSEPDADAVRQQWADCELAFEPFQSVRYFYPYEQNERRYYAKTICSQAALETQVREGMARNYIYTYEHDKGKLRLFFANVDDPSFTVDSMLAEIAESNTFASVQSWEELLDAVQSRTQAGGAQTRQQSIAVQSWRMFHRHLGRYLGDKSALGTGIFQNAISGMQEKRHAYLSDAIWDIQPGDVYVVDIAALDENDKFVVFGDVVDAMYRLRTEKANAPQRVIVFVDELNKYAPAGAREKDSPIIQKLIEVTERGRSQGMILFGAQQFKSAVHDRVTGNCSNEVYGRTNSIETTKAPYRGIPKAYVGMMLRLPQGSLIVNHPLFPKLLKVEFPRPCYHQPKPL
jgi:hypothetical protein